MTSKNKNEHLVKQLSECIKGAVISLNTGMKYKLKDILPPEVWGTLNQYERRELGRVLSRLVKQNIVPLMAAGRTSANHRQYTVKH